MSWVGTGVVGGLALGAGGLGLAGASALKGGPEKTSITPYTGRRPESPSYTKESEKAYYDTILPRSQGIGVGYDPSWLTSSTALINSQLGKEQEDRLRDTKGSLSASGLSGNPRAYEATAGRVQRDTQREMQDAQSKLNIANMERANQERDVNTGRLGQFNQFEFGQGNTAANFDLGQWQDQNQLGLSAAALNDQNYWKNQAQQQALGSDIASGGGMVAGMAMSPSALKLAGTNQPGTGISSSLIGNPSTSSS